MREDDDSEQMQARTVDCELSQRLRLEKERAELAKSHWDRHVTYQQKVSRMNPFPTFDPHGFPPLMEGKSST